MSDETYDGLIMSMELSGWKSDIPFSSPGAMGGSCGRYSVTMQYHATSLHLANSRFTLGKLVCRVRTYLVLPYLSHLS